MKVAAIVSILIGLLAGGLTLYVSWSHNPQCEFHCEGDILWANWLPYGLASFIVVSAVSLLLLSILIWGFRVFKNVGANT